MVRLIKCLKTFGTYKKREWYSRRTANSAKRLFVLPPAEGDTPLLDSGAFIATFFSFAPTFERFVRMSDYQKRYFEVRSFEPSLRISRSNQADVENHDLPSLS